MCFHSDAKSSQVDNEDCHLFRDPILRSGTVFLLPSLPLPPPLFPFIHVHVSIYAICIEVPQKARRFIVSPGATQHEFWKPNSGIPQEQYVVTIESS